MSDQPLSSTTPATTQSLDEILNQLEKTTGTQAAPVAMSSTNLQPASTPTPIINPEAFSQTQATTNPVATITENPITSTMQPKEVTTPAPMFQEEPHFDTSSKPMPEVTPVEPTAPIMESAPVAEPIMASESIQASEPAPKTEKTQSSKRPWSMNKIAFGVAGVLVLAVVIGAGYFLTQQNQDNRMLAASPAPIATTVSSTSAPSATPVITTVADVIAPKLPLFKAQISGTICAPQLKTPGTVILYNTTLRLKTSIPIAQGQTKFQSSFYSGNVVAIYVQTVDGNAAGYTNADHGLKSIDFAGKNTASGISICDLKLNPDALPTSGYTTTP